MLAALDTVSPGAYRNTADCREFIESGRLPQLGRQLDAGLAGEIAMRPILPRIAFDQVKRLIAFGGVAGV